MLSQFMLDQSSHQTSIEQTQMGVTCERVNTLSRDIQSWAAAITSVHLQAPGCRSAFQHSKASTPAHTQPIVFECLIYRNTSRLLWSLKLYSTNKMCNQAW